MKHSEEKGLLYDLYIKRFESFTYKAWKIPQKNQNNSRKSEILVNLTYNKKKLRLIDLLETINI